MLAPGGRCVFSGPRKRALSWMRQHLRPPPPGPDGAAAADAEAQQQPEADVVLSLVAACVTPGGLAQAASALRHQQQTQGLRWWVTQHPDHSPAGRQAEAPPHAALDDDAKGAPASAPPEPAPSFPLGVVQGVPVPLPAHAAGSDETRRPLARRFTTAVVTATVTTSASSALHVEVVATLPSEGPASSCSTTTTTTTTTSGAASTTTTTIRIHASTTTGPVPPGSVLGPSLAAAPGRTQRAAWQRAPCALRGLASALSTTWRQAALLTWRGGWLRARADPWQPALQLAVYVAAGVALGLVLFGLDLLAADAPGVDAMPVAPGGGEAAVRLRASAAFLACAVMSSLPFASLVALSTDTAHAWQELERGWVEPYTPAATPRASSACVVLTPCTLLCLAHLAQDVRRGAGAAVAPGVHRAAQRAVHAAQCRVRLGAAGPGPPAHAAHHRCCGRHDVGVGGASVPRAGPPGQPVDAGHAAGAVLCSGEASLGAPLRARCGWHFKPPAEAHPTHSWAAQVLMLAVTVAPSDDVAFMVTTSYAVGSMWLSGFFVRASQLRLGFLAPLQHISLIRCGASAWRSLRRAPQHVASATALPLLVATVALLAGWPSRACWLQSCTWRHCPAPRAPHWQRRSARRPLPRQPRAGSGARRPWSRCWASRRRALLGRRTPTWPWPGCAWWR